MVVKRAQKEASKQRQKRLAKRKAKRRPGTRHRGRSNLAILVTGDDVLFELTGKRRATRYRFVQLVWGYIKKNKLQLPENGRMIRPDSTLSKLMGKEGEVINAFTMMKYIEAHLTRK
jgi:chromatin remodeling complex protein RSC6